MTTRYLHAKCIALAALEHPAAARRALLDTRCGADAELRQEVEWLLQAADTRSGDGFVPGWELPGTVPGPLPDGAEVAASAPDRYRIVRLLGEGGMGVVYLAERVEGDSRQTVALKFLNAGSHASPRLIQRLADERRILASLNHPNIAHLVDGGSTADGRSFIAMEYVDGQRIDRWCEQQQLSLQGRIGLFLKVCAAVEHAHQRLVIHRDLKPANILVTAEGEPKLLDFGIARLLDDTLPAAATQTSHRALTLAYASPEQIEGRPLTTAADTWALGVLLYELLAGRRPHQHLEAGHQLPAAILSGDITPPSRHVTRSTAQGGGDLSTPPLHLVMAGIPADLDAIVLKALRHDPQQRYATVGDLAADLRNMLASRPVSARRGHLPYRAGRFMQRNRWGLAAACVLAAIGIAFLFQREQQLQMVTAERNKAQVLSAFMGELFANADPSQTRGEQVTARELLDRGAKDLQARKDLDSSARASLGQAIGNAYLGLQLGKDALPMLQTALQYLEANGAPALERGQLLAQIVNAHAQLGENDRAIAASRQGQALLAGSTQGEAFRLWAGLRLAELGNQYLKGELAAADMVAPLQALIEAVKVDTTGEAATDNLIAAYEALANAREQMGERDTAIAIRAQAVQLANDFYKDQPGNRIVVAANHATSVMQRDPAEGVRLLQALDQDYARLVGEYTPQRAILLNQLAVGLKRLERQAEALETSALATAAARRSSDGDNRLYLQIGVTHAINLMNAKRYPEAEALLHDVLPGLEARSAPGVDAVNHAYALGALGRALLEGKQAAREALPVLQQAERILAPHATDFLVVYDNILRQRVLAHASLQQPEQAQAAIGRYQQLLDKHGEPADSNWRVKLEQLRKQLQPA